MSTDGPEQELRRVSDRIAAAILEFCWRIGVGAIFHMADLNLFVQAAMGGAPNSSYRVFYELQRQGRLRYTLLHRRNSQYRLDWLLPPGESPIPQAPAPRTRYYAVMLVDGFPVAGPFRSPTPRDARVAEWLQANPGGVALLVLVGPDGQMEVL